MYEADEDGQLLIPVPPQPRKRFVPAWVVLQEMRNNQTEMNAARHRAVYDLSRLTLSREERDPGVPVRLTIRGVFDGNTERHR